MTDEVPEDVIQRRLLIDGDGTGDDRRLNLLQKSFIKWASSEVSPSESQIIQDKMLSQLAQCEYALKKSRMIAKASSAQLRNHERFSREMSLQIETAKKDIETMKGELEQAKKIHNNQVEYEVLGNAVKAQPSRKLTDEELKQVKEELLLLEKNKVEVKSTIDLRGNQCHIVMAAIQQLQYFVETNESKIDSNILDEFDDEDLDILSRPAESDDQMDES